MAVLFHKWLLLFFIPFFPHAPHAAGKGLHPLYVTVTEIHHNAKERTLEISCKIFADDMEEILEKNYKKAVDLTNEKQAGQNNNLIADYISSHFSVTADAKRQKLEYLGFEKEAEAVYCYFEVKDIAGLKKLDLTNSLLQDLTTEQINIMHVVVNGNRKSYKLDYPQQKASFQF
jgi:hypothetical protein